MLSSSEKSGHKRRHVVITALLALWAATLFVISVRIIPDFYWYSYYSIDYTVGFVRRGLAGELASAIPGENHFLEIRIGRWSATIVFLVCLAVLARCVAVRSGRSDRRLLLAFLIPVLPFGFAFGLLSGAPTLFGAAALAIFAVSLMKARSDRSVLIASAVYGLVNVVAALLHEAIPFLFGLGALVALITLANLSTQKLRAMSYGLALAPGLMTSAAIAVLGKRGVSDDLCALIPHGPVYNPGVVHPTLSQLLNGFRYYVDYHAWACRNITPLYDQSPGDAIRYVGLLGPMGMVVNTVFGIGVVAFTMLAISWVSGVPIKRFAQLLRQHWLAVAFGFCLTLPVFMTGIDWVRWWVIVAFDIGGMYTLYASRQPEVDALPTRRTIRIFALVMVVLALFPVGAIPAFGAPWPIYVD